ncbi:MAG TPA: FAD:protein FMN transferase [Acidimicrobiia bacterium]|nr:FAD:protein FMN transferase [Acidimicrobiia bacterium]
MGTDAHVLVHGRDAAMLADTARDELDELERRWSRFLPDSEVSRLNAAGGAPRVVSPETSALVSRAVEGWEITHGRFDPTVLGDVVRAGYDQSFERVPAVTAPGISDRRRGCAGIHVDEQVDVVRLPAGVGFDPGGIGKGYAADRVVGRLMSRGARGACVNVGGDIRVVGVAPDGSSWVVDVVDPFTDCPVDAVAVGAGGVATTSRTKRRWMVDGRPAHHVIDPATGRPAARELASVTTIAAESWLAEVFAKGAFVAGMRDGLSFLEHHGVAGSFTDARGRRVVTTTWSQFTAGRIDAAARQDALVEDATY